jgi:hypothetical protein
MVTSATKDARFVHPPEVEPCGLVGVEEGVSVGVGGVVAAGGGVVAVGEASVGVVLAGLLTSAVAGVVPVGGCADSVGLCRLAVVAVGVVDTAMPWVGAGVALGDAGTGWVEAGWPAGASVKDAPFVGAAVGVLWPMQAASTNASGIRNKNRFTLPGDWDCLEAVLGDMRAKLMIMNSRIVLRIWLSIVGLLPIQPFGSVIFRPTPSNG